jgi:hypothetical protein
MNNTDESPRSQLLKAVVQQKTATLEAEPSLPELADLHAALMAYNEMVTQAVFATLQGVPWTAPEHPPTDLEDEFRRLETHPSPAIEREVRRYRQHQQRLDEMLRLAQAAATSTHSAPGGA